MQPANDSVMLREYAENHSDEAFAALVTRHINLVYSIALRQIGNPHHAEEITQAVFIILAKKAGELRHDKALSSWLFQATRLTANNFLRSDIRRRRREQEAYMRTVLKQSESEVWPGIAPMLDTAVASLNGKDRRAIVLRFYERRTLDEVGAALGASEDAAKKRVNRALEKLRAYFSKRGIYSTAATIAGAISANSVQAAPVALVKTTTAIALAKGATASISTSTLIKGALKIMAWTKAKSAIVTAVVVLLVAGAATVAIKKMPHPVSVFDNRQTDISVLQGTWSGQEAGGPAGSSVTIQGSNLEFHGANPNEWYKATFTLHEDTTPKQLIAVITECSAPQYVGKTSYAIYQIQGDTITMVGNEPGKPNAPPDFNAPGGRKFIFTKK